MSAASAPLVTSVYQAVSDPARWDGVVSELAREIGAPAAALVLGFRDDGRAAQRFCVGVAGTLQRAFADHLTRDRDLFAPVLAGVPRDFQVLSEPGPSREFLETRFYREWMRPQRLLHLVAGRLHGGSDHVCGLGVMRGEGDPPFGQRELDLLADLAPHLERALDVQEAVSLARATEGALARIAETLRLGVLVVEGSGRLLFANRKARSILAQRDGLMLERPALCGASPSETLRLRRAVAEAARPGSEPGAALVLSRASGRAPLRVLVNGLRPSPNLPSVPSGAALLVLVDSEEDGPIGEEALRRRYGFTPAETRVAARIARGERPAEIAAASGVQVSTVRTHLQRLLEKTGTHHQAQLVRCLLTGSDGWET